MVNNFYRDLEAARSAEHLVRDVFASLSLDYTFEEVGGVRDFFYRGDIKATAADGREIFIEVKDDSRIADTGNVLCEEEVYYKKHDYLGKGNMSSDYDIYVVVSRAENKMYVIDFKILKENYHKGTFKRIEHPQQETYCYLCELWQIDKWGGLIAEIDYKEAQAA